LEPKALVSRDEVYVAAANKPDEPVGLATIKRKKESAFGCASKPPGGWKCPIDYASLAWVASA